MKILYKQPAAPRDDGEVSLFSMGIRQLFLKEMSLSRNDRQITEKRHHHQSYEIHILKQGRQIYGAQGKEFRLQPGQLLLIPPTVPHRILSSSPDTQRYSVCFSLQAGSPLESRVPPGAVCLQADCPVQVSQLLAEISQELAQKQALSSWTVCAQLTILVLSMLRLTGLKKDEPLPESADENTRLILAKQFIADNVEMAPSVSEVAAYCHLSSRQLTRHFLQDEGCTPAAYIRDRRFRRAEDLLLNTDLPLKQISERMQFSTEFYFNTFFKRHAGMTPCDHRKMHRSDG